MEFTRTIGKASTSTPGSRRRLWIFPLPWAHGSALERFWQGYSAPLSLTLPIDSPLDLRQKHYGGPASPLLQTEERGLGSGWSLL